MKALIIFSFLLAAVLAYSIQEKWDRVHSQCQSDPDLFVDEIIFQKLRNKESVNLPANFGQHAHCMLRELGLQDHRGNSQRDGIEAAVEKNVRKHSEITRIVNECSSNRENKEKTALAIFKCLGDNDIDIGQQGRERVRY